MIDISNFTCSGLNSNCLFCSPAKLPLLIKLNNLTLFLTSHFLLHWAKSWWIYFQNISRIWLYIWTSTAGNLDSLLHSLAPTVMHFSSVAQSCPTLCDPMDCSMPGFPVHHQLWELAQTHVHWVSDAIQPSHPLSSTSPPAFSLSQHHGLFKWVTSSHQVAKVLEFQHQSFQWIFRTDFL